MEQKGKGLSIAALVLGIIGVVLAFIPLINTFGIILGVLALIFGIIGIAIATKKAKAIVAVVLAIAAIGISIGMKAATVKAVDDAVKETTSALDDITGDNTEKLLKENVDVTFGTFTIESGEFIDNCKLPVTVTNKGKEKASFSIQIEAVDENGKRIDDDSVYVNDLNAGQSQDFEAFTLISSDEMAKYKTATFKIVEISKF